jgi:two-component system, response regulator PdtaR
MATILLRFDGCCATFTSAGTVLAKVRCRRMKPPRRILNQPVVLLVEDEFLVRQTLVDILREAEFWVVEAQDADEAFELLRSRTDVAAVLTDVNMPGSMDGFEFARLVRQGWPEVGVIVISGQADPGPSDLPSHATFLRKPFRPAALIKTVREVMATG